MKRKDFVDEIWDEVDSSPKCYRKGQAVFNAIEELWPGLARAVQFGDGIDCFYDDEKIEPFIDAAWKRIKGK